MSNKSYILLLLWAIMVAAPVYGDIFEECDGEEQTYIAVEEDCSFYIFCHGEDSFSDSCPKESPYFSVDEQTCDTDRRVCKDRPILIDLSESTTEGNSNEVASTTVASTMVASTSSTNNIFPTAPSPVASTAEPSPTTTTISSSGTISSTTTATPIQTATTTAMPFPTFAIPSSCPTVDNLHKAIFLPHTKSCSDYFLCYQGKRLPMHCSYMLHFDVRQQRCDYPQNVKCQIMDNVSPREQCLSHTFDLYPHPRNCNYYYQCTLGYLRVMHCPLNMGWHYEKRACVMRSRAKCYNSLSKSIVKY